MAQRRPTTPGKASAIRQLRLDAWRPVPAPRAEQQLGSLRPLLRNFTVPAGPVALVPAQRTAPEVADRLRGQR